MNPMFMPAHSQTVPVIRHCQEYTVENTVPTLNNFQTLASNNLPLYSSNPASNQYGKRSNLVLMIFWQRKSVYLT